MKNVEIEHINDMLDGLSEKSLVEVADFTAYLFEKQRRHKTFAEETLDMLRKSDSVTFDTADEAMDYIMNWRQDTAEPQA
jgi:hypothetical protein